MTTFPSKFPPPKKTDQEDVDQYLKKMSTVVSLLLDKASFVAGEMITGRVILYVETLLKGARSLTIEWIGFEKTRLTYDLSTMPNLELNETITQKKPVFVPVTDIVTLFKDGEVQPGRYEFSVEFQTPSTLPGVFSYYDDTITAAIKYKAIVRLHLENQEKEIERAKKLIYIVPSSAAAEQAKSISVSREKRILFARGKLGITAILDYDRFSTDGAIPFRVHVNNRTGRNVRALKVKLMQEVKILCCEKHREKTTKVAKERIQGIKGRTRCVDQFNFELDSYELPPSTNGSLIASRYYFVVECNVLMGRKLKVSPSFQLMLMPKKYEPIDLYTNLGEGCWREP